MPELDITVDAAPTTVLTILDTSVTETVSSSNVRLKGWSLRATSVQGTLEAEGSALNPAAGSTITSLVLGQGEWVVSWEVVVTGTTSATDVDNFQIWFNSSAIAGSTNGSNAGQPYPQENATFQVGAVAATISIKNIVLPTVGATYSASLSASPLSAPAIAEITSGGSPQAEISLPIGVAQTVFFQGEGITLQSDLTLSVITGTLRGAVFVQLF